MTKRHSKLFNLVLCAVLCLLSIVNLAAPALAQEAEKPGNNLGTLKITAIADNKLLVDKTCKLYYVADMEGVLDQTFASYKIKITDTSLQESTALANLLESIILRDNIKPDYTAKTNQFGVLQFDSLIPGVYILLSTDSVKDGVTYLSQPSLFIIGYNQILELEIKHTVKYPEPEEPDKPKTIQKIIKKWDDGKNADRPNSIKVQLLRNGKVQETVQLSAKNNWRYTWTNLDKYAKWSVVEIDIPDDYEMEVSKDGLTTIITNSKTPETPPTPPEKPDKPEIPTKPEKPEIPEIPEKPEIPEIPTKPNIPKLPQTGTTWFYVPILAAIGLAALFVGLILHKNRKDELPDKVIKTAGLILIVLGAGLIFLSGIVAGRNQRDESYAENQSNAILRETEKNIQSNQLVYAGFDMTPDYLLDNSRDMPVVEIDGLNIIGQVTVPDLSIDLPVCDNWDAASAKSAPCRYTGSAYTNDLIIAGHSYKSHFRQLYNAKPDMLVKLTDMDGNLFEYVITETLTIDEHDFDTLDAGSWDLTLFTCTSDSRHRVLVRCQLLETT